MPYMCMYANVVLILCVCLICNVNIQVLSSSPLMHRSHKIKIQIVLFAICSLSWRFLNQL